MATPSRSLHMLELGLASLKSAGSGLCLIVIFETWNWLDSGCLSTNREGASATYLTRCLASWLHPFHPQDEHTLNLRIVCITIWPSRPTSS